MVSNCGDVRILISLSFHANRSNRSVLDIRRVTQVNTENLVPVPFLPCVRSSGEEKNRKNLLLAVFQFLHNKMDTLLHTLLHRS